MLGACAGATAPGSHGLALGLRPNGTVAHRATFAEGPSEYRGSPLVLPDGTEFVAGPGDITSLPSGHDAWVVGDEPAVVVDWYGASNYAKPKSGAGPG